MLVALVSAIVWLGLLLSLRIRFAAVLVYAVLPIQTLFLHVLPGAAGIGRIWAGLSSSFPAFVTMLVLMVGIGVWTVRAPLPR